MKLLDRALIVGARYAVPLQLQRIPVEFMFDESPMNAWLTLAKSRFSPLDPP
jgi:hypothetical protein